jgi:hypothetical protein
MPARATADDRRCEAGAILLSPPALIRHNTWNAVANMLPRLAHGHNPFGADLMPRPYRFLFLSLAAVAVALAIAWLACPRSAISVENATRIRDGMTLAEVEAIPSISKENATRIRDGMTLAEVEAILGGPARDESNGQLEADVAPDEAPGLILALYLNGRWMTGPPAPVKTRALSAHSP